MTPTEKEWTAKMAPNIAWEAFFSQKKKRKERKSYPFQFCYSSSVSSISLNSGNINKWVIGEENLHKSCTSFQDLAVNSPSVTRTQRTEAQRRRSKKILKAQTVAATLMQPCLARNTLLYHLLYKYTASFFSFFFT